MYPDSAEPANQQVTLWTACSSCHPRPRNAKRSKCAITSFLLAVHVPPRVALVLHCCCLARGRWLVKIKTDSAGDVHYEAWSQPHGEKTVLTKPKILTVPIKWLRVETVRNGRTRYIMSADTYQRLVEAVR